MKRILLGTFCLIMLISFDIDAQDKKATIGLGFGGASASAQGADDVRNSGFGINFYINGMYNLNENISLGLEYNGNTVVIGDEQDISIKATSINGILPKGRYYFGSGRTRAFAGAMLGLYFIKPGEVSFTSAATAIVFERKAVFGFAPEVGVSIGAFQLATSYHFVGNYKSELDIPLIGTVQTDETYSVWQFSLGWNIGIASN
jgi:hypothetical protein